MASYWRSMKIIGARLTLHLWSSPIGVSTQNSAVTRTYGFRCLSSTATKPLQTVDSDYVCNVDAEPLHRYRAGGYHPIRLGDLLNDGRYKVLHKLGWGGYSTVWAARDLRAQKYVALKVSVSERGEQRREHDIMRTIAANKSVHLGFLHLTSMIDSFQLCGPNGTHDCFALEMMGPSVSDVLERRFRDERLPGKLAKSIAKQALLGLDCLHQLGIAHGDMHTRNLAFAIPCMNSLCEEAFLQKLRKPEIGAVKRKDGESLDPGIPDYLVRPTYISVDLCSSSPLVKIVDFGESFPSTEPPKQLHTPLTVRAPEAIFEDRLDDRVDIWSMGCMLFELITGQPPFDSIMINRSILVGQMLDTTGEELPERWRSAWRAMESVKARGASGQSLEVWLEEVYYDGEREVDLTREDVIKVGQLVRRMLRLEPSARASARQVLQDPWFNQDE